MQPNVLTNNRAPQLGQYQSRSNYEYSGSVSSYRPHQRTMISNGDMNTVGFHNFNSGASSLFSNVPSANICNISDTIQILNPLPSTCNIKFRRIPFFKLRREILKPSILSPNSHLTLPQNLKTDASQEFQFGFVMTCAVASELAMNRDITKSEYPVLAQLRITMVDIGSPASGTEYDDVLPLGLVIRVNGRQCTTLPPCVPSSRPNQEARRLPRPINVTHLMKLSPVNANILTVNWTPESGKQCIITINIVEKLSAGLLLDCLKQKPRISVEITKATIRQQYRPIDSDETSVDKMVDDEDIATTIVRVSLLCPLAKFPMKYPAKGKNCTHLQCFDGSAYISLNEKKPMWNCPVCNKCLHYDDLLLDEYFMNVIQNEELSGNCHEVQLFVDGTWKSYFEDHPTDKSDPESKKKNSISSSTEVKQLTNPSKESMKDKVSSTSESVVDGSGSNCDVVNLLSEDEDSSDTDDATNITAASSIVNPTGKKKLGPSLLDKSFKEPEEVVDDAVQERAQTLLFTTPDTSSMTTNVKKNHQTSGIISLDSPSPPSPAKSSLNDLSS